MATKKIKLIKPYGLLATGVTISPDVPVADLLIQSGRAVAVETEPVEIKEERKVIGKIAKDNRRKWR